MRNILVVVDMQNDFVVGPLGSKEAQAIIPSVVKKIKEFSRGDVYATRDTHGNDYLQTVEGGHLPVVHCLKGTRGWELIDEVKGLIAEEHIVDKPTFGSLELAEILRRKSQREQITVELIGVCTDICVVSNALLLKAFMPEVEIYVDISCCAGVTPKSHEAAIRTMEMCQIYY